MRTVTESNASQHVEETVAYTGIQLPFWRKITFGVGGLAIGIIKSIVGLFQLVFLLEVVQIKPVVVGIILLFDGIFDSITDPIVGFLIDNYPTSYGRRKPWIYLFSLPLFIFWTLSWISPGYFLDDDVSKSFYFLFIFLCFSFFSSFVIVPFQSIIPDIAPNTKERLSVILAFQAFSIIGATCSTFIYSSAILYFPVYPPFPFPLSSS